MIQLLYISTCSTLYRPGDMATILAASRRNNTRDGLTGMLLFNGRRFLQALEGETAPVREAFERIRRDGRHKAVVELSSRTIASREFGEWAMAHDEGGEAGRADFLDRVDMLTAAAGANTRAHFLSYATLNAA